jgi:hypothetical protein
MIPDITPDEPAPAIALPIMRAIEFGAAPQTAEPTSNRQMEAKKMFLTG